MKFEITILSGLIILLIIILYFKKSPTKYTTVKIENAKIRVEIADTLMKRTKGLIINVSSISSVVIPDIFILSPMLNTGFEKMTLTVL